MRKEPLMRFLAQAAQLLSCAPPSKIDQQDVPSRQSVDGYMQVCMYPSIYVTVYMCMYIPYMYVCMYLFMHVCLYLYVYVYMHYSILYVCMYYMCAVYTYMCACISLCMLYPYVSIFKWMYVYI